jgi:hypothetical protein
LSQKIPQGVHPGMLLASQGNLSFCPGLKVNPDHQNSDHLRCGENTVGEVGNSAEDEIKSRSLYVFATKKFNHKVKRLCV